jgi:glycosyltransferase involved in cell wall biosynthesis
MNRPFALVVCPAFPLPAISGGRKRSIRLIEAIEAEGISPQIVTVEQPGSNGAAEAEERGWDVVVGNRQPAFRGSRHPLAPSLSADLRDQLLTRAPHALFVQFEEYTSYPYLAYCDYGRPSIMSSHNIDGEVLRARAALTGRVTPRGWRERRRALVVGRLERRCARHAEHVFAVSSKDADFFSQFNPRVSHVPNGVDAELLDTAGVSSQTHPPSLLFFGQLAYAPNVDGLLRFLRAGWQTVLDVHPQARLVVVGNAPPENLKRAARTFPNVTVKGFVPHIGDELRSADLVIAPLWVGGGTRIKVLEAMAAARPVVGTPLAVEGIGFLPGVHGLVGDTPEQIGRAVSLLISEGQRSKDLGRCAREHARQYVWDSVTLPAREVYSELRDAARA